METRQMENVTDIIDVLSSTVSNFIIPMNNQTQSMKNQLVAYDILIPLLGSVIIATNLIVVISSGLLIRKGQQPRCTYLLLGNVAMADLITGIAVIVGQSYPKANRTHAICSLQLGMIVSSTVTSIYSVGLIAVDRFLYILHGLKYHRWVYPTRARCMITATWILGLIVGFLPMMGWSGDTNHGKICWFIVLAPPNLVVFTTVVGILPVVLVVVLYSIILFKALKKVIQLRNISNKEEESDSQKPRLRMFRGSLPTNQQQIQTISSNPLQDNENENVPQSTTNDTNEKGVKRFFSNFKKKSNKITENDQNTKQNQPTKWKAVKVVLFTTGSFVCTWMPYFIACTMFVFCDFEATPLKCQKLKYAIASPLAILGFINSLLNPVIYAWWHNGFRKSLKKICCKKSYNRNTTAFNTTRKQNSSSQANQTNSTSLQNVQTSNRLDIPDD